MKNLVNKEGFIEYGIYEEPIDCINYKNFNLRTPSGLPVPGFLKKFKFNMFNFAGIAGSDIMAGLAVVDLKYNHSNFIINLIPGRLLLTKLIPEPYLGSGYQVSRFEIQIG